MPVAGSLAYEITLKTDDFVKNIAKATAAFFALKFSFKQFAEPFEEGFRLRNLSKQTNESISSLFKFEWGLKAVGISSEEAGTLLTRFQKALGAVNAQGVPLQKTFAMMGLNIQNLRRMSTADAFDLWAAKLKTLNKNSAAFAATALAGGLSSQTGAGSAFLRIARSIDDVREAMRRARAQGQVFEKFGETFYQIIRRITLIKDTLKGFFVGLAGGASGGLLYLLRQIDDFMMRNQKRIIEIGKTIGMVFGAVAEALKEGKLFSTIELGLKAAFEAAGNLLVAVILGVVAFLMQILKNIMQWINISLTDSLIQAILNAISFFIKAFKWIWEQIKTGFTKITDEIAMQLLLAMIPGGKKAPSPISGAFAAFSEAYKNAPKLFGTANQAAFAKAYAELLKAAQKLIVATQGPGGPDKGSILGGIFKLPVTAIEKMGFTFRGGLLGVPGSDYAKMTAQNTAQMALLLTNTNQLLSGRTGGGFDYIQSRSITP